VSLRTQYEFTLPRGYVDREGAVHRSGVMRLATARDELEPLRDPTIQGPDDPRLTIVVLARVVERLGTLELVTAHEIENLFAADLAYLQDFYGVINFGTQEEFDAFLAEHAQAGPATGVSVDAAPEAAADAASGAPAAGADDGQEGEPDADAPARPGRSAIQELGSETR